MTDRTILHINIVNFHVAIARIFEPKLAGYPVAVRAAGSRRVLLDVSSEACDLGVSRGMIAESAKRICPDLVIVDPVPSEYQRVEKYLLKRASAFSPLTEPAGPGHFFIDLTGTRRLNGSAVDVADTFRKTIRNECRIDCAVGLAASRLVSKIATRVIKPDGLCSVISGCEEEFMAPLPVQLLPGLESRIMEQLLQFNLRIIRDLNGIPLKSLATVLGPSAYEISRSAHGIDDTPVRDLVEPAPSVMENITLGEQTNDECEISGALFHLVSRAGARIRKMGLAAGKICVSITYADGTRSSRSVRLLTPARGDLTLYEQSSLLLRKLFVRRVRLTELATEFTELTFPYGQIDLFSDTEREENLMSALDSIRCSFGENAIKFWGRQKSA
jgi:DNA polymerase-4